MVSKAEVNREECMVQGLRRCQTLQRHGMELLTGAVERTRNELLKIILAIVRNDCFMHHQILQLLIDSAGERAIALGPGELARPRELILAHRREEEKADELAAILASRTLPAEHGFLLGYLYEDERKHARLVTRLAEIAADPGS